MDSLFDDDHDDVGSEIEAYCPSPRCKADTNHTVVTMYEDEVRRVQCAVCGDIHTYRKPKGDSETTESGSSSTPRSSRLRKKPSWEEAMAQVTEAELNACRPYSIRDTYEELDVVSHPKFGVGFVTELLPDNKVEITFKEDRRVLVHNRSDLAQRMPEIADTPPPRDQRKKKRKKKPASELAQRLLEKRAKAGIKRKDFAETAAARLEAAERAAEANRQLAVQLGDLEKLTPAERRRVEREAEKERKRLERERERERKAAEREKEREKKAAEREKELARKAKEREKLQAQRERERAKKQKERERELAKKQKEREKLQAQRERERAKKQKEREKKQLRRTGGKKSVPSTRTAARKPARKGAAKRSTPKRTPAKKRRRS